MVDNLSRRENFIVPGAMGVLEQRDVVAEAAGAATRGVNTEVGLVSGDNQVLRAQCVQIGFQAGFKERIRRGLGDHDIAVPRLDFGMDLPSFAPCSSGWPLPPAC